MSQFALRGNGPAGGDVGAIFAGLLVLAVMGSLFWAGTVWLGQALLVNLAR